MFTCGVRNFIICCISERVRRSTNTESCNSNSCGQHGYCSLDLNGKFSCRCYPGHKGEICQKSKKINFFQFLPNRTYLVFFCKNKCVQQDLVLKNV